MWSVVIRGCSSTGAIYYFKAVGPKPPDEFAVVGVLREAEVIGLPTVLAYDRSRRWAVLVDAGRKVESLEEYGTAMAQLARVQIASRSQTEALIAIGCVDRRPGAFALAIQGAANETDRDNPVAEAHLLAAAKRAVELAADLEGSCIGATVVHEDFRPGNVVVDASGLTFLDWSDTAVGHPFFSPLRFIDFVRQDVPSSTFREVRQSLLTAYLEPWLELGTHDRPDLWRELHTVERLEGWFHLCRWRHEILQLEPGSRWAELVKGFAVRELTRGIQSILT